MKETVTEKTFNKRQKGQSCFTLAQANTPEDNPGKGSRTSKLQEGSHQSRLHRVEVPARRNRQKGVIVTGGRVARKGQG